MAGSVYNVIELIGTSDESWERAATVAVERAARSLRELRVAQVVDLDLQLGDGGVVRYRARLKLSFKYDDDVASEALEARGAGGRRARAATAPPRPPPAWQPGGRVYGAARGTAGSLYRMLWNAKVEGLEHIPGSGPAIIAANHISFFDSIALVLALPRRLGFVGKSEYLDSWKTRRLLPALGMIPVDRGGGRQALGALEAAARILEDGGLFAIYPEGTRSRDGKLHAGHRGVGYLALATGAPIIPTGIIGTDRVQPPGARLPRPFRPVVVRFGASIDPGDYQGVRRNRRRRITDDVMTSIQRLSGQEWAAPTV